MRRSALFFALTFALPIATVASAPPAFAQDDDDDLFDEDEEEPTEAPPAEDEEAPAAEVDDGSIGGATGFVFKNGLYLTSELGGFIRFGGYGDTGGDQPCLRCEQKVTSNIQPWIALTIGYDFLKFLGAEVTLGTGFIADAAAVERNQASPENSQVTMVNVAVTGSYYIDRFAITGKGFVGGALLTPAPFPEALPAGGQVGVGVGLRYATLLTNVVIGIDVASYLIISPDVQTGHIGPVAIGSTLPIIPAISFAPVIKYTF